MAICYWCGQEVANGEGAREHIVPHTLLQDTADDISDFVLPVENAHETCNQMLAKKYEHDFCQTIFHYSANDPRAQKHVASKLRNLQRKLKYAANQFKKMRLNGNRTEIALSATDKEAFEQCIRKIIKGLSFKNSGQYLDLDDEWSVRIIWNTFNLEHDATAQEQVKSFLELFGNEPFNGNDVFKYRFRKVEDGLSSIWEFLFYDRFPVYAFLVHKNEKSGFKNL
jgi:hypothetical protein